MKLIKCLNPFCQQKELFEETKIYCFKCGYSQGAGQLVKDAHENKLIMMECDLSEKGLLKRKQKIIAEAKKYI